jgi:hypothetical protein
MEKFIILFCPSCGNKLRITEDTDIVTCVACSNEYMVYRSRGIVSLKPVMIDNVPQSENVVYQLLSDLRKSIELENITPQERNNLMDILNEFKKEMDRINEEEEKAKKANEFSDEQ